jgi:hypothetical protein
MELRDPVELTRGASMAWFATAARKRVCVRQQQSRRQPPLHHRRSGKRCLELPAPAHNPRIRNGAVSVALERWSRSRVLVPPNRKMATCSSDISIVEARARSRQPGARSVFRDLARGQARRVWHRSWEADEPYGRLPSSLLRMEKNASSAMTADALRANGSMNDG